MMPVPGPAACRGWPRSCSHGCGGGAADGVGRAAADDGPRPDDPGTAIDTQWTPIGRDEAAERRLTARVAELLAEPAGEVTSGRPADAPSS